MVHRRASVTLTSKLKSNMPQNPNQEVDALMEKVIAERRPAGFVFPEAEAAVRGEIVANKELRRDLDVQIQKVKLLPKSHERALCITKLQEAVMWLGMDLKRINEENPGAQENPYPNSKDPSNLKIEPTADGLKL